MKASHVFRHPLRKGATAIAIRPLTGMPRDDEGRLILEYVYETRAGAAAGKPSPRVADSDPPAPDGAQASLF